MDDHLASHARRRLALFAATLALVSLLPACASTASFQSAQGNGQVVSKPDQPFEAQFDGIWLTQPGKHVYQFEDLPSTNVCLLLSVQDLTPGTADRIAAAGANVKMTLVGDAAFDEPKRLIVREGRLEDDWPKTAASWKGDPLEYVAMWFRPRPHERFTLTVEVSVPHPLPNTPGAKNIWAMPIIRAGVETTALNLPRSVARN